MKKKLIPVILLIAAGAGIASYYSLHRSRGANAKEFMELSGNIEAHESLVGFKIPGRIVALPVEEGQEVAAGSLLARLDQSDYRQQVAVDEALVNARSAELKLAQAGSRSQEKKAAEQLLLDAKADFDLKKLDLERYQALYEKDEVAAQVRDAAATGFKRSQAMFERARQNYELILAGTRKEQIAINQANVLTAQQALGLSRIKLGYTELTAPTAGVVLVRQAEIGEVILPGAPVLSLADLNNLWLRGYIAETDLGRVKLGQAASVRIDTYPGRIFKGRLAFISAKAEFTPKTVETHKERVTLVYRVKIAIDNPGHELKPGMPADATIALESAK
ncbi:MAG: efflux RND transporter periplasmic adaptor subunit [Desulfurivibrionaceae bacterium]